VGIEFRDLRWAVVAAQHRSLRQAAEALNVRQSTLGRSLRDLEIQLGAVHFERSNGGTRPTLAGSEFLEGARKLLDDSISITERFKTRSRGGSGQLRIGLSASSSAGNLRATLVEYRRRSPDVEVCLIDGTSDHLIADLSSPVTDIAFMADDKPLWEGGGLTVWSERVVVALPEDHKLCDRDMVRWRDLNGEVLLLPQRGPGPELLNLLISKLGCSDLCRLVRHDVSLDRLLSLVGVGWGLLLALEGATGASYSGVTFREVHEDHGASRLDFRAYWRQTNCNPTLQSFLEVLTERYPDLSAAGAGMDRRATGCIEVLNASRN
jgi:DNA-binding transcriptional LysR family regulator